MNQKNVLLISLIFLCIFFSVNAIIGTSEIRTQFSLFSIEVLLMIIAKLDSNNTKTT